jgi:SNF2 family DNA or RNA helicase
LPTDDGQLERVSHAKANAVDDILDSIDVNEPVVIFYRFETDKTQLREIIKNRKVYELSGKVNELQKWKDATGGEVLIVQIQSGNAGVSFVRSMYCIYYSIGYSAGDLEQSTKRQHRSGQERNVMYYHVLCKNTVDIDIYNAIFKKMKTARDILNTSNADAELLMALLNKRKEQKGG